MTKRSHWRQKSCPRCGEKISTNALARAAHDRGDKCGLIVEARALTSRIRWRGYNVRLVEYCEDSRTPGFLGQIRGVTDHERKEVKIGMKANNTPKLMAEILAHELRHIEEPEWDCGGRDVFGRGGQS
jgi:hypothetical protein